MLADMNGKHVIVTGATNGIGEVTALELARMGASVTLISRNKTKLEATAERIRTETGNNAIDYLAGDLSSVQETHTLAQQFLGRHDQLDVLVNNAGAVFTERQESVDGIELTLALNHLGYFVLTNDLLGTLKATAAANPDWGARIVNVSSAAHTGGMNWDDIEYKENYPTMGFGPYGQSKLMNVYFTYELARRLEGTGVTVNALHPGLVNTGFGSNNTGCLMSIAGVLLPLFGRSPKQGAETSIYLASSPDVKGVTGKYFANCKAIASSDESYDEASWTRLWTLSEEMTGMAAAPV